MAIPTGFNLATYNGTSDITESPRKTFVLASLDDSGGIIDPQSGDEVTARAIRVNVAGTLAVVDPFGNVTTPVLAAGETIVRMINGVKSTGTVTITATDVEVML